MTLSQHREPLFAKRWIVFGASGFVGSAIIQELENRGAAPCSMQAPRLKAESGFSSAELAEMLPELQDTIDELASALQAGDIIINAAGLAQPDSPASAELFGANALMPLVLAEAASKAQACHFIHLSSAAVQGSVKVLDSQLHIGGFSPYAQSKSVGEFVLVNRSSPSVAITIVRATSVQGPKRSTTRNLQKIARSPLASVASPGTQPTTVSSIYGLVDFVLASALDPRTSPRIVLQPWEGGTVESVLELAGGGRKPVILPATLCIALIACGKTLSHLLGSRLVGQVRRLELMWFGQAQETSHGDANPSLGPSENLIRALSPVHAPTDQRNGT